MTAITEPSIIDALRRVIDPDLGINIVDLGLVERIVITPDGVDVALVMTTPACPQGSFIADEAKRHIRATLDADTPIAVTTLETPLWQPSRLSDAAKATLGW